MDQILIRKKQGCLHRSIWRLESNFPDYSVRLFLSKYKRKRIDFVLLAFLAMIILLPHEISLGLFFLLNFFYLIVQLFKSILILSGSFASSKEELLMMPKDKDLPIYTILLPVYNEEKILQELINSIDNIDYPKNLLDVKLLIEADDNATLEAIKKISFPSYFEIIEVPVAFPRTKPKACNYGLQFAKGTYIVVYDAEDRPNKLQLKQVVAKFAISSQEVVCIQARLNYYNRNENILTKLFAIEYSLLFDYMLEGLKKFDIPIPLGGTSNHFICSKLEELGGWDAFNVTEDADLGIRLHQHGYRTKLINNITLEEAPISLESWITQRARWVKGHILTSMIHLRRGNNLSFKEVVGLHLFLSLPNLIYLVMPFFFILRFFNLGDIEHDFIWQINICLGITIPIFSSLLVILAKKWYDLIPAILLVPFYYFLLPISGIKACWQICKSPFHWDKTTHGVSKFRS